MGDSVKACILVRVQPGTEPDVIDALESVDAIADAFPVLGQPEIVVRVHAPELGNLAGLIGRISEVDGVVVSETLLEIPEEAIS